VEASLREERFAAGDQQDWLSIAQTLLHLNARGAFAKIEATTVALADSFTDSIPYQREQSPEDTICKPTRRATSTAR
jgi:hypothetical protein